MDYISSARCEVAVVAGSCRTGGLSRSSATFLSLNGMNGTVCCFGSRIPSGCLRIRSYQCNARRNTLTLLTAVLPPSLYQSRRCHNIDDKLTKLNQTVGFTKRLPPRRGSCSSQSSSQRFAPPPCVVVATCPRACSGSHHFQHLNRLCRIRHKILCACFNRTAFAFDRLKCVYKRTVVIFIR